MIAPFGSTTVPDGWLDCDGTLKKQLLPMELCMLLLEQRGVL